MTPVVIDIYHGDPVTSFAQAKGAGILGVIHKASQAQADPAYANRRKLAGAAGMLWGAYHFNTAEPVNTQLDRFFAAASPDAQTRMCLDFEPITDRHGEPLPESQQMSLAHAVQFLEQGSQRLGRRMTIYSGNRIKETIIHADTATREKLAGYPFWLCEYGKMRLTDANGHPLPWSKYDLWQYAADGIPHTNHIPGIPVPGVDVNCYDGTPEELAAGWAGPAL